MKQIGKLLLASFLAIMLVLPFVAAAPTLGTALKSIFGVEVGAEATEIIIVAMIWLVLAVGISDLLIGITPFSDWVCWVIGIATTIIAANLGGIMAIFVFLNSIFAILGGFTIYAILICGFLALWGVGWAYKFVASMKIRKEALKAGMGAKRVRAAIEGFGEAFKGFKGS